MIHSWDFTEKKNWRAYSQFQKILKNLLRQQGRIKVLPEAHSFSPTVITSVKRPSWYHHSHFLCQFPKYKSCYQKLNKVILKNLNYLKIKWHGVYLQTKHIIMWKGNRSEANKIKALNSLSSSKGKSHCFDE